MTMQTLGSHLIGAKPFETSIAALKSHLLVLHIAALGVCRPVFAPVS